MYVQDPITDKTKIYSKPLRDIFERYTIGGAPSSDVEIYSTDARSNFYADLYEYTKAKNRIIPVEALLGKSPDVNTRFVIFGDLHDLDSADPIEELPPPAELKRIKIKRVVFAVERLNEVRNKYQWQDVMKMAADFRDSQMASKKALKIIEDDDPDLRRAIEMGKAVASPTFKALADKLKAYSESELEILILGGEFKDERTAQKFVQWGEAVEGVEEGTAKLPDEIRELEKELDKTFPKGTN